MSVSVISQIVSEGFVHYLDAFAANGVLYGVWTEPASAIIGTRLLRWRNQAGAVGTEITASITEPFVRFAVLPVVSQNALLVVWQNDDSADPDVYVARFDLTTGALLTGPTWVTKGLRPRLVERTNGGTDLDPILAYVDQASGAVYLRASWDGGITWEGARPVLNQMARDTVDLSAVAFDSGHVSIAQLANDARRLREIGSYSRTRPVAAIAVHPTAADQIIAVESSARDVLTVAQLADTIRGSLDFNGTNEVIVPTRKRLGTDDAMGDLFVCNVADETPTLAASLAIPAGTVAGDGVCRVALPGLTVNATISPIFNGTAAPNAAPVAVCVNGTTLLVAGYSDTADNGLLALIDLGTNAITYTSVSGLARALGCDTRLAAVGRSSPAAAGHAVLFGANAAGITTYVHKLPSRPNAILVQMDTATTGQVFIGLNDRLNVYQIDALNKPIRLVMSIPIFTRGAVMQIAMMPNGNLLLAMGEGGVAVVSTTGEILAQTLASGIYAAPWQRNTVYALGATVSPTPTHAYAAQRRYFRCTTGGTSGSSEPAWSPTGTVADNTVVWTEVGPTAGIVCGATFDATRRRIYAAGVLGGTTGLAGRIWSFDSEGLFTDATSRVSPVTFSLAAGTYTTPQSLALTTATPAAGIYYTLDGSTPTTASTLYTGAIPLGDGYTNGTYRVRAMAVKAGLLNSFGTEVSITINLPAAAAVVASPAPGAFLALTPVTLTTSEVGADIRYTLDGSTPSLASPLYTAPFTPTNGQMLKAGAFLTGRIPTIFSGTYYKALVPADPADAAHVLVANGVIVDVVGNAWTPNGSVPVGAAETLVGWANAKQAQPLGPFTDANNLQLGAGADVLDFLDTEDFALTFIMKHGGANAIWFSNGLYATYGYYLQHLNGAYAIFGGSGGYITSPSPNPAVDTQPIATRPVHVVSVAKIGHVIKWKIDSGAVWTLGGAIGALTPAMQYPARIGRYESAGNAFDGRLYEIRATKKTVTDADLNALHAAILA